MPERKRALKMRGKKVGLAVMEKHDLPKFKRWLNDPKLSLFMREFDAMLTAENMEEWYMDSCHDEHQIDFAIVNMEDGALVGACTLIGMDRRNSTAELRIFIGRHRFWNQGYGSEAMLLLLDYAFNVLNLNSVYLKVNEINKNAIHVYKKLGFRVAGKRRQARAYLRKRYDLYLMDMLAKEFDKLHKSNIAEIIKKYSE